MSSNKSITNNLFLPAFARACAKRQKSFPFHDQLFKGAGDTVDEAAGTKSPTARHVFAKRELNRPLARRAVAG